MIVYGTSGLKLPATPRISIEVLMLISPVTLIELGFWRFMNASPPCSSLDTEFDRSLSSYLRDKIFVKPFVIHQSVNICSTN